MQSNQQSTAVHEILKSKLEAIAKKHMEILGATESIDEYVANCCENQGGPFTNNQNKNDAKHVVWVEEQVNSLALSESYTAKDALTLAINMDELLDKMIKCHQAISLLNCGSSVPRPTEMLQGPVIDHGPYGQTEGSPVRFTADTDNNAAATQMLKAQIDILLEQVSSLQESYDTKLEKLETKVMALANDQVSVGNSFDLRMQNVEARCLLLQDVQLSDGTNSKNLMSELSKLRIEVMSVQDDVHRLDVHQSVIGERIMEVESKTDDLVRLRNILNDLHMNVTQREELTQKFNELEEEMTRLNINCVLSPLLSTAIAGNQDDQAVTPAFTATFSGRQRIKPGDRICFQSLLQEGNDYDPATSIFTAPVGGLYLFSVSVNVDSQGGVCVAIVRNAEKVAFCGTSGIKDEQSSTTVFLRLSPGDMVWIEADVQTCKDGVYLGGGYSNFAGCFLK